MDVVARGVNHMTKRTSLALFSLLVLLDLPISAAAQPSDATPKPAPASGVGMSLNVETVQPKSIGGQFVYSVKFLCGTIPHGSPNPEAPPSGYPLSPGTYRTAININNPNLSAVYFTKLALITNPQGQLRGRAGKPVTENLQTNQGLEVDCKNIGTLLSGVPVPSNFAKGFVVIRSRWQLDVVGVYTVKNVLSGRPGTTSTTTRFLSLRPSSCNVPPSAVGPTFCQVSCLLALDTMLTPTSAPGRIYLTATASNPASRPGIAVIDGTGTFRLNTKDPGSNVNPAFFYNNDTTPKQFRVVVAECSQVQSPQYTLSEYETP